MDATRPDRRAEEGPRRRSVVAALGIAALASIGAAIWWGLLEGPKDRSVSAATLPGASPRVVEDSSGSGANQAPERVNPLKQIEPITVASVLSGDRPLRLVPSGQIEGLAPGAQAKVFFTTQRSYRGEATPEAIATLIDNGAADALESSLRTDLTTALAAELAEFDESLRDLALLIDEEETAVRAALRQRPDRRFHFLTTPIEVDAEYPRYRRIEPTAKEGTVWGDPCDQGQISLVVLWSEWPLLKSLCDDRSAMLADRFDRTRRWIEARYRGEGMSILAAR